MLKETSREMDPQIQEFKQSSRRRKTSQNSALIEENKDDGYFRVENHVNTNNDACFREQTSKQNELSEHEPKLEAKVDGPEGTESSIARDGVDPLSTEWRSQNPEEEQAAEPHTGYPVVDLSRHFVQIEFSAKDDPSRLEPRSYKDYMADMLVIEVESVVQWPRTFADESLIRPDAVDSKFTASRTSTLDQQNQSTTESESQKYCEDALTCCVCFNLVTEPQDCVQCDATLCGRCCKALAQRRQGCPQRCQKGFKKGHKLVRQMLDAVVLACPNKTFYKNCPGVCEVVLKYADMKAHLEERCPYRIVQCAGHPSCNHSDFARNIRIHEMSCQFAQSNLNRGSMFQQQPNIKTTDMNQYTLKTRLSGFNPFIEVANTSTVMPQQFLGHPSGSLFQAPVQPSPFLSMNPVQSHSQGLHNYPVFSNQRNAFGANGGF